MPVHDDPHRKLKARAVLEGLSLSDYLLKESECAAGYRSLAELRARLATRTPFTLRVSPAKAVRAERAAVTVVDFFALHPIDLKRPMLLRKPE
jgi:hypothetical protein